MTKSLVRIAGSDAARMIQVLEQRVLCVLAGTRSRYRAMAAMLATPANVVTVVAALEAVRPLFDGAALQDRLLGYSSGLAAARGNPEAMEKQLKTAEKGLIRALSNGDGVRSTLQTRERTLAGGCSDREARSMRAAWCKRPRAEELSACDVGRLPANARFAAAPAVTPSGGGETVPEASMIAQAPASETWPLCRLKELLTRTDRFFPAVDQDRPAAMPVAANRALRATAGRFAVIYRARYRKLEKSAATTTAWWRWFAHSRQRMATLTASSASTMLMLWVDVKGKARVRAISPQQYASLSGIPLDINHPIRRGLGVLKLGQQRSVIGQGVDYDCAIGVWRWVIALLASRGLPPGLLTQYGDVFAGISIMGAALRGLVGAQRFRYRFAFEISEKAARAHARGWLDGVGEVFADATQASNFDKLDKRGMAGVLVAAGFRCAPFSTADAGRRGMAVKEAEAQCALAENAATLRSLVQLLPNAIVLETAANILNEQEHWEQLQAMVLAYPEFSWSWQVICPRMLLRKPSARRRLFLAGVRLVPIGAEDVAL